MIKSAEFTAILVLWAVLTPAVALIVRGFVRQKANRRIASLNKRVRALRDENNELGAARSRTEAARIAHLENRIDALNTDIQTLSQQNAALQGQNAAFADRPIVRILRKPSKRDRIRLSFREEASGKVVAVSTGSYHAQTADETAQRLAASRFEVAE